MILYGTNPIAWANDDDTSIGADVPTERILAEAGREIGFDGIENGHRWPDNPAEVKALLGGYGLRFISGWYSTELLTRSVEDEIEAFAPHLAKLQAQRLGGVRDLRDLERDPRRRRRRARRQADARGRRDARLR